MVDPGLIWSEHLVRRGAEEGDTGLSLEGKQKKHREPGRKEAYNVGDDREGVTEETRLRA